MCGRDKNRDWLCWGFGVGSRKFVGRVCVYGMECFSIYILGVRCE